MGLEKFRKEYRKRVEKGDGVHLDHVNVAVISSEVCGAVGLGAEEPRTDPLELLSHSERHVKGEG